MVHIDMKVIGSIVPILVIMNVFSFAFIVLTSSKVGVDYSNGTIIEHQPQIYPLPLAIIYTYNLPPWFEGNAYKKEEYIHLRSCSRTIKITENQDELEFAQIVLVGCKTSIQKIKQLKDVAQNALFAFYTMESPSSGCRNLRKQKWMGSFNLSWSYHVEDSVHSPYPRNALKRFNSLLEKSFNVSEEFQKRQPKVMFLHSNCELNMGARNRFRFVKNFMKSGMVASHGPCLNNAPLVPKDSDICNVANRYMFYFSIENANHEQYISEKFWNALSCGAIPIVFSGKQKIPNYGRILPVNSYIDVAHVKDKSLEQWLREVSENEILYEEFMRWRSQKENMMKIWRKAFPRRLDIECQFCDLLKAKPRRFEVEYPSKESLLSFIN